MLTENKKKTSANMWLIYLGYCGKIADTKVNNLPNLSKL
jgi:hypothetical protein